MSMYQSSSSIVSRHLRAIFSPQTVHIACLCLFAAHAGYSLHFITHDYPSETLLSTNKSESCVDKTQIRLASRNHVGQLRCYGWQPSSCMISTLLSRGGRRVSDDFRWWKSWVKLNFPLFYWGRTSALEFQSHPLNSIDGMNHSCWISIEWKW